MSLSVLVPATITTSMVTSTVAETDYAAWASGTTYAVGQRCISTTTHRVYESLVASNTNHDPTDISNLIGTTPWWLDVGATNRWKMFDDQTASQTVAATTMTVTLEPGSFNGFALLGLSAETITATVTELAGSTTLYSYTGDLENSAPDDYYEFFFGAFSPQTDFIVDGLDAYATMRLVVTLTVTTGDVKCGMLQVGDLRPLGLTQYGAKAKPKTYSYIKVNEYGENEIVRRKKATDLSCTAWLKVEEADSVNNTLGDLLDVPCLWIASDLEQHRALRVFGLGSGDISFDHLKDCLLTLNVNGLI